jgi:hypothetical protein
MFSKLSLQFFNKTIVCYNDQAIFVYQPLYQAVVIGPIFICM